MLAAQRYIVVCRPAIAKRIVTITKVIYAVFAVITTTVSTQVGLQLEILCGAWE